MPVAKPKPIQVAEWQAELHRIEAEVIKPPDCFTRGEIQKELGLSINSAGDRIKRWLNQKRAVRAGTCYVAGEDGVHRKAPYYRFVKPGGE